MSTALILLIVALAFLFGWVMRGRWEAIVSDMDAYDGDDR